MVGNWGYRALSTNSPCGTAGRILDREQKVGADVRTGRKPDRSVFRKADPDIELRRPRSETDQNPEHGQLPLRLLTATPGEYQFDRSRCVPLMRPGMVTGIDVAL